MTVAETVDIEVISESMSSDGAQTAALAVEIAATGDRASKGVVTSASRVIADILSILLRVRLAKVETVRLELLVAPIASRIRNPDGAVTSLVTVDIAFIALNTR